MAVHRIDPTPAPQRARLVFSLSCHRSSVSHCGTQHRPFEAGGDGTGSGASRGDRVRGAPRSRRASQHSHHTRSHSHSCKHASQPAQHATHPAAKPPSHLHPLRRAPAVLKPHATCIAEESLGAQSASHRHRLVSRPLRRGNPLLPPSAEMRNNGLQPQPFWTSDASPPLPTSEVALESLPRSPLVPHESFNPRSRAKPRI